MFSLDILKGEELERWKANYRRLSQSSATSRSLLSRHHDEAHALNEAFDLAKSTPAAVAGETKGRL